MADTYSDRLGLIKIEPGTQTNEWGTLLNINFDRLDSAIRGYKLITLAGAESLDANDILTTSSVGQEESFFKFIEFRGTAGTVTVPAEDIFWIVYNNTGSNFTFQPSGGTGVPLVNGRVHFIVYGSSGASFVDVTTLLNITQLPAQTNLAVDNISIDGNTITTTSGGLTLDSTTGTTTVSDNLSVTGTFTSTGIDDNATSTALTLDTSQNATFAGTVDVSGTDVTITNAINPQVRTIDSTNSVETKLQSADAAGLTGTTSNHPLFIRTNNTDAVTIDTSQNATFTGDVTVQGAFASLGIDDNATGERLQIANASMQFGTTGIPYVLEHVVTDQALQLYGGNSTTSGSIILYGSTHATLAGDVAFRSSSADFMFWNESAGTLTINTASSGSKTLALTLDASQNATFSGGVLLDSSAPRLDVDSGAGQTGAARIAGGTNSPGTGSFDLEQDSAGNTYIRNRDNTSLIALTNNTTALTIDNSQNATFAGNIIGSAGNEVDSGLFAIKASDESVSSSTTLQDDDDLVLSLAANTTYHIQMHAIWNAAASTPDVKYAFVAPAGTTFQGSATSAVGGTGVTSQVYDESSSSISLNISGDGRYSWTHADITVTTAGTAGDFKLQWSQNISSGAATTCKASSWIKATKLG